MFRRIATSSQRTFRSYGHRPVMMPISAAGLRIFSTVNDACGKDGTAKLLDEAPRTGVLHYQNGKSYNGDTVAGKKHGTGVLTFPDGRTFRGVFHCDRLVSGSGTYVWANKTICTGSWQQGKMHGQGRTEDAAGNVIEGEYRHGKMFAGKFFTLTKQGHVHTGSWTEGKFSHLKVDIPAKNLVTDESKNVKVLNRRIGHGTYTGDTMFGKRHGVGRFACTQYTYSGQWVHNQRCGEGKISYADGSSYQGQWKADAYNGQGKLLNADGTGLVGEFRNGRICNGTGKLVVQSSQEKQWKYTFEGTWVEGKMQGSGTKTLDGYYTYVGTFKDGEMHGPGFLREITGEEWRGEFRHNVVHRGEGSLVLPDGAVLHGRWEDGKHVEAFEE